MSKIGNIMNSYGNSFEVAIANTYSYNVMNAIKLPPNTFIVASPFSNNVDNGTYSLILTDSYGVPARITYCISEGNGLVYDDVLSIHIDKSTIKETNGSLKADIHEMFDHTVNLDKNPKPDVDYLNKISAKKHGVAKVDGSTIKSDNGEIYVETSSLDVASSGMKGILIGDGSKIMTSKGKMNLNVDNINHCDKSTYGVLKAENNSINISNGDISLNDKYFIGDSNIGLVKNDNNSITSTNGIFGINLSNFQKANASTAGTVKLGNEFVLNQNGQYSVNSFVDYANDINSMQNRIDSLNERIDNLADAINVELIV